MPSQPKKDSGNTLPRARGIVNRASIKLTSAEEVLQVLKTILDDKAPGPDGIPNKVLKIAIKANTKEYVDMYNACLTEGVFPSRWKTQRLVLITKGEKPAEEPSSYRPLCMLDTVGKLLERIIHSRLEGALVETYGLSEMKYGIWKGLSTIDAVRKLCEIADKAIEGKRWLYGTKQYCIAAFSISLIDKFNKQERCYI